MKVTRHAAVRFLERVMNKSKYTKEELNRAYKFLEEETKNIVVQGYKTYISLPSFKQFRALVIENRVITILPKEWRVRA